MQGVSPSLLRDVLFLIEPGGYLQERQIMDHCQIGRTLARAALATLVDHGDLELVAGAGPLRYQRRAPLDEALVRHDLMPELLTAIGDRTQTAGHLVQRFNLDKAVINATVRAMQRDGLISVTTVGATQVCRVASVVMAPPGVRPGES